MKRVLTGIVTAVLAASLCAATAFAANPGGGRRSADADGDGVCDNFLSGQGRGCAAFADADGDGVCDNFLSGRGRGCGAGGRGNGLRGGRNR